MPLADSKKAQTVRNLFHANVAQTIAQANVVAEAIRAAIAANNLAAEFPQAQRTALQSLVTDLATLTTTHQSTFDSLAASFSPSHRSRAIAIAGVND